MSFLLDTCVISELIRPAPERRVIDWISGVDELELHLSVLTLGEIEKGITKLPSSPKRKRLARWLEDDLLQRFDGRILDVSAQVAFAWGRMSGEALRKGRPLPVIDALIAATALEHGLTVVTRNSSDIARTGAAVLDPWS